MNKRRSRHKPKIATANTAAQVTRVIEDTNRQNHSITASSKDEPSRNAPVSPGPFFRANWAVISGGLINLVTVVVLILTLQSYKKSNEITQDALSFTQKTWRISKVPFLYLDDIGCELDKSTKKVVISYKVINSSDNPALITSYGFVATAPNNTNVNNIFLEETANDWIAPKQSRQRVETFIASSMGDLPLYGEIIGGGLGFTITVKCQDNFPDPDNLTFTYKVRFTGATNQSFSILSVDVQGMPTVTK